MPTTTTTKKKHIKNNIRVSCLILKRKKINDKGQKSKIEEVRQTKNRFLKRVKKNWNLLTLNSYFYPKLNLNFNSE